MSCRSCGSTELNEVLDLGDQYLSDFRDDDTKPGKYPLRLLLCKQCALVQLRDTTPRELMYHDRYGFRSGVNEAIKADLKSIVDYALTNKPNANSWLDIACNDGTLLSNVPDTIWRSGIDPVAVFKQESEKHANRIIADFFNPNYYDKNTFDIITSISMFYDLDDPNEFVAGVKSVLAEDGIWVIQQNYLLTMISDTAFDNVCHEHITYFSLTSLEYLLDQHGLEVNDVGLSTVNGGCFRTLVSRKGTRPVAPSVAQLRDTENAVEVRTRRPYDLFADRVNDTIEQLKLLINTINGQGKSVYMYGASTRGQVILQAAGLDVNDIPFAVERQQGKVGKKVAGLGIPIISEEEARAKKPDYLFISPWFFADLFVEREAEYLSNGGTFIIPLPQLKVVP